MTRSRTSLSPNKAVKKGGAAIAVGAMAAFFRTMESVAYAEKSSSMVLCAALCVFWPNAYGLTPDQAKAIAVGEGDARIDALRAAIVGADEKTVQFIQALADDAVKLVADKVIVKDDKAFDPVTGLEAALPDTAEDVMNNNRMRGELDSALATLKLLSPDVASADAGHQDFARRSR
jgi:hypothetical protein